MNDLVDVLRDPSRPGQMTIRRRAADEIERLRAFNMELQSLQATDQVKIERLRAALRDARQGLNLGLLADGLNGEIKNRLRTSWLKVGDALKAEGRR